MWLFMIVQKAATALVDHTNLKTFRSDIYAFAMRMLVTFATPYEAPFYSVNAESVKTIV